MTRSLLLVSLAAGSLTAPAPASSAATELAIRAITVRPAEPVVGAHDSVRLVIDVIAKGAGGKNGVTVKVEPGTPPGPVLSDKPSPPGLSAPPPAEPLPEPFVTVPPITEPPATLAPGLPSATPSAITSPVMAAPSAMPVSVPSSAPSVAPEPVARQPEAPSTDPRPVPQQLPQPMPAAPPVAGGPGLTAPKLDTRQYGTGTGPNLLPPRLVWRTGTPVPARMTGGWQTWRFLPDKKLNRFYPSGTWTITATARDATGATVTEYASFQLRRATKLSSFRVESAPKSGGDVRLRGSLTRVDPRGYTDYGPFGRQRLEIQWREESSSTWQHVAETTTDAAGSFVYTVPSRMGGFWRVRYPGTAQYAPYTSKHRKIAE